MTPRPPPPDVPITQTRLALLQAMPVFGALHAGALGCLLAHAQAVTVARCGWFFHEGETGEQMFVLESGRFAILKAWEGREYLLREFGPGDCFGEIALLDFCPRSASGLALTECSALAFDCSALYALHERDPEQFVLLQMNLGRELCRRLRVADEQLFRTRIAAEAIEGYPLFDGGMHACPIDAGC